MDEAERAFRHGFRELVNHGPALGPVDLAEVLARGGSAHSRSRGSLRRLAAVAAVLVLVVGVGAAAWSWLGRTATMPAVPAGAPSTAELGLVGPRWLATRIGDQRVIANGQGEVPFLVFAADGSVTGGDPCNGVRGTYRLDGRRLLIPERATTDMACGEDDVVAQQSRFMDAVFATREARRSGETLELLDASGAVVASFVAESTSPTPTSRPSSSSATPTNPQSDSPVSNAVQVRIRNDSAVTFDRVDLWLDRVSGLAPGASSDYLTPPGPAYRYAKVVVTISGREIVLQPVDFVGETPLEPGRYTYALSVTDEGDLALEFETDE